MDWVVAGYQVPSTWFDAANSLFCVILGPVTAALWKKLAARPQGDMSLFRKTGLGIAIIGVGYLFYAAIDIMRGGEKASVLWLIVFAFLLTMGEMFFSPLGHSFISKYSPSRYLAVMMSVWGFATFIGAKSYGPVYGLLFGGKIEFKVACIGVAVVSFGGTDHDSSGQEIIGIGGLNRRVLDKNNDNCIDMPETDLGIDTLQKKMTRLCRKRGVRLCAEILN